MSTSGVSPNWQDIVIPREDVAGLVRLRVFLEHAVALAGNRSEPGRHGALVALDGVCEYAMFLAVHRHGVRVRQRASFHETATALGDHLSGWNQQGRRGVLQMHEARNQAQHAGALPDPEHMLDWTDDTQTFVRDVVDAAFGVSLDDVLLADSIADVSLRDTVANAERALGRADATSAFDAAVSAFTEARRRWREQQSDAYDYMPTYESFSDDPRWLEPTQRGEDYVDVGVFAGDLGEYHWLLATRRQVAHGLPLTVEDARRGLLFAFNWILRWQRFDVDYPRDRWRAHWETLRPPTVGRVGQPSILAADVDEPVHLGNRDRVPVVLRVADIPEDGRGDWGADMTGVIAAALEELGMPLASVEVGEQRPWVGQLKFLVDVAAVSTTTTAHVLTKALAEATRRYESRRVDIEERAREDESVASQFSEFFAQRAPDLFGAARVEREVRSEGETQLVSVDFHGNAEELWHAGQIFSGSGGVLASATSGGNSVTFVAFDVRDSAGHAELLESAIGRAKEQVAHLRQHAASLELTRLAFERDLSEALVDDFRPDAHETGGSEA